jgi:2,3-dihydroxybenzoate-AMP ligase
MIDDRLVAYPSELVDEYLRGGLWQDLTIAEQVSRVAARFPHRPAVETRQGSITYSELDERSDRLAAGLVEIGVPTGGPVILQIDNSIETVVTWYGLLKAGLIPVCTLLQHRRYEIESVATLTRAVAHVVPGRTEKFDYLEFAREMRTAVPSLRYTFVAEQSGEGEAIGLGELGRSVAPEQARTMVAAVQDEIAPVTDIAVFQLSGGTTGTPKVIPRLHAEYWYNSVAHAARLEWNELERAAHLAPVVHNAGIVCSMHAVHAVGGCLVLGAGNTIGSPELATELVVALRVTSTIIGQPAYGWVTSDHFAQVAGTLRQAIMSGGKVPRGAFDRLTELGIWSGQLFGMGEGLCAVTPVDASPDRRANTVGTPVAPLDEVAILEPGTENRVEPGVVGELCCRGPYTLHGYFDAAEHNRRAFTSDGFYRTGDLASVDVDAGGTWISIEGRIKDLINRGGEKINAEELEDHIAKHPNVAEVAVVAMPDERLGERACAYLVAVNTAVSLDVLREHLAGLGVAKYKWPEKLVWVDELPLTAVNKINKKALRDDVAKRLVDQLVC